MTSRSRRLKRPAIWSISAPVRITALIGLPRVPTRGCNTFDCRSCWGRSGEALISTQFSPSAVIARLAWVRGRARTSPAHAKRHVGQRQFHCGKPPPAAEPSTMAERRPIQDRREASGSELGRQVSVDLEADADLDEGGESSRPWCSSLVCLNANNVNRLARARKSALGIGAKENRGKRIQSAITRKKTGPLRVRFAVCRRGGRQSPSRGEQLTVDDCNLGGWATGCHQ